MTDDQMEKIRVFAKEYIASWQEKIRLKLGGGINGFQTGSDQVLFLDPFNPSFAQEEITPWSVAFYGNFVSRSQGRSSGPGTGGQSFSWDTTVVGEYGLLMTAGPQGINQESSRLSDRIAFFQTSGPDNFASFEQQINIGIPIFQFAVQIVFRVVVTDPDGNVTDESEDVLNFYNGNPQQYEIVQEDPGRKTVTAIDVRRL